MGSNRDAFLAGQTPKINPMAAETTSPVTTAQSGIEAGSDGKIRIII